MGQFISDMFVPISPKENAKLYAEERKNLTEYNKLMAQAQNGTKPDLHPRFETASLETIASCPCPGTPPPILTAQAFFISFGLILSAAVLIYAIYLTIPCIRKRTQPEEKLVWDMKDLEKDPRVMASESALGDVNFAKGSRQGYLEYIETVGR